LSTVPPIFRFKAKFVPCLVCKGQTIVPSANRGGKAKIPGLIVPKTMIIRAVSELPRLRGLFHPSTYGLTALPHISRRFHSRSAPKAIPNVVASDNLLEPKEQSARATIQSRKSCRRILQQPRCHSPPAPGLRPTVAGLEDDGTSDDRFTGMSRENRHAEQVTGRCKVGCSVEFYRSLQ